MSACVACAGFADWLHAANRVHNNAQPDIVSGSCNQIHRASRECNRNWAVDSITGKPFPCCQYDFEQGLTSFAHKHCPKHEYFMSPATAFVTGQRCPESRCFLLLKLPHTNMMVKLNLPWSLLSTNAGNLSKQLLLMLLQAELQMQLAEYTAADWEGYKVMQLKIQALVSCFCTWRLCAANLISISGCVPCWDCKLSIYRQ